MADTRGSFSVIPAVIVAKFSGYFFAATTCAHTFFFFPSWWEYLTPQPDPNSIPPCSVTFSPPGDFLAVGLAILDMLLRLAGFAAVIAIIIAGVEHLFSGGDPQKAAAARSRLWNSIIGLAIAMTATAIVAFIGRQLK